MFPLLGVLALFIIIYLKTIKDLYVIPTCMYYVSKRFQLHSLYQANLCEISTSEMERIFAGRLEVYDIKKKMLKKRETRV